MTANTKTKRRSAARGWNRYAFSNSATRREAKALLFQELAEAVRNGMPLDEALELCMRTEAERTRKEGYQDASTRARVFQAIVTLFYLVFATCGAFILLIFSSAWAADVERVARILALRLLPLVRAGHSLSGAMEMLRSDYAAEEIEIVRAGESWNNLPDALERLGKFQYYERELQRHWARMSYPLTLLFIASGLVLFCMVFIAPKFMDIYNQLGIELPTATQWLVKVGGLANEIGIVLIVLVIQLLLFIFLLRLFAVGNRVLRDLMACAIVIFAVWVGIAGFSSLSAEFYGGFGPIGWMVVFVFVAFFAMGLATIAIFGTEKLVLWIEKRFSHVFGNLPLIGAPRQTERESRWLAALSLGLASGQESADAVAAAGRICGGEFRRRSDHAAAMVQKGYSIGRAVIDAQVLRQPWANRLRLLDDRGGYLEGLADIAEDAARQSFHSLNRSSRVAEVISICILGIGVGFFAYAMYMPLFNIPLFIGNGL